MATKYAPLTRRLMDATDDRLRLSFAEIERVLGFSLPRSARAYAPWWANTGGSHSQAEAWMDAGWRTAQVDVPGEKVTFKRVAAAGSFTVEEAGSVFVREDIKLDPGRLSGPAAAVLADYLAEADHDPTLALSRALEDAALTRRRRMIDWFKDNSPRVSGDSTDIIREERDAR